MNFRKSSILLLLLVTLALQSTDAKPEHRRSLRRTQNHGINGRGVGKFFHKNNQGGYGGYGGYLGVSPLNIVLNKKPRQPIISTVTINPFSTTLSQTGLGHPTFDTLTPGVTSFTDLSSPMPSTLTWPCSQGLLRRGDKVKPVKEVDNDADAEDNEDADIQNGTEDNENKETDVIKQGEESANEVVKEEEGKKEDVSDAQKGRSIVMHRRRIQVAKRRNQKLRRQNQKLKIQLKKTSKAGKKKRNLKAKLRRRQQVRRIKRKAMHRRRRRMLRLRKSRILAKKRQMMQKRRTHGNRRLA